MNEVLICRALSKRYGAGKALDALSMRVPQGAIYGLIGRNGAGKTTLLRVVCGLQRPDEGAYSLYGVAFDDRRIGAARRRVGAVIEAPALYGELTAAENLKMQYRALGLPDFTGLEALLRLSGLEKTGRKKARHFSLGMRQRLSIAVALAGDPDFLLLDEPVNGLDPQGIVEVRELILRLNREKGVTVLISSHILDEMAKVATCYGFIDGGRMLREIAAADLRAECGKRLRVETNNTRALSQALEELHVSYKILSDTQADLYDPISLSRLSEALTAHGGELLRAREMEESLESYYINLLGGEKHA